AFTTIFIHFVKLTTPYRQSVAFTTLAQTLSIEKTQNICYSIIRERETTKQPQITTNIQSACAVVQAFFQLQKSRPDR
ncbi:MAG: hypothetical protein II574_10410, partial [Ruminococcus sp.]|nr:hypothetical protein [Ruminococcus sp.]